MGCKGKEGEEGGSCCRGWFGELVWFDLIKWIMGRETDMGEFLGKS